ncbi:MAG: citrulline utilization hydrolase CtlX [Ilumatobacter sp.]|jgi:hypothetical protein|uniref:citrulline utilization hydrolase CtlX n=1 Tax=Ilumatobacter sp. TaxID=1967498 RepID=UPI0039194AB9
MALATRTSVQAPRAVVMIRPHHFEPNEQTRVDNVFQTDAPIDAAAMTVSRDAFDEATAVADVLQRHGIAVHLFDDDGHATPDSVFPNNWFSTHHGGHVAVFPMCTPNRRLERRSDVIEMLKQAYRVQDVIDYSGLEVDGLFLEGTGAMVLDHLDRIAYVARSHRADPIVLERFCTNFGYEPMAFDAVDPAGIAIYHTNVLMCVATSFALVGLDAIVDATRRDEIVERLAGSGRDVIALRHDQVADFAGNAFELTGSSGSVLAMSTRARRALTTEQIERIEEWSTIVDVDIPTIELAGGSVRCMLAGIHLQPR